jgi:pimeloyl-ACP methyl ester carboxylesterase
LKLNVIDHGGEGRTLVLLHAFPLDSGMYDRLVPLLVDDARVVTIDLPGLGGSPVPDEDPSMAAVAEGVLDALVDLGIERSVVVGSSTGGYVALEIAAVAPHRLEALVLAGTTPRRITPDVPDERRVVADEIERLHSTDPIARSASQGLGATAHREQPGLVSMLRQTIAEADPAGVTWMARAIAARSDTTAALAAFAGPVGLLFGAEDEATPPSRGQEMLTLRGSGSTILEVLDRTGHLTALESPKAVAAFVLRVLAEVA